MRPPPPQPIIVAKRAVEEAIATIKYYFDERILFDALRAGAASAAVTPRIPTPSPESE